jgi:hypothetical protein
MSAWASVQAAVRIALYSLCYGVQTSGSVIGVLIIIQEPQDFARLSRAITLKRLVSVNGGDSRLTLKNYLVGRVISFPGFKTDQNHILDYRIARFYFHSVHYFHDFEDKMEQTLNKIDQALRSPSFATIVDEKELLSGKRPDDTVVK